MEAAFEGQERINSRLFQNKTVYLYSSGENTFLGLATSHVLHIMWLNMNVLFSKDCTVFPTEIGYCGFKTK